MKTKPKKPRPDFPLFPHACGRWAKKVRGQTKYFGYWDDPDEALKEWLAVKDYLLSGLKPPSGQAETTVSGLCDAFYESKRKLCEIGQLTPRSLSDYDRTCKRIVKAFGRLRDANDLRADDFAELRDSMAKTLGPVSMKNEIGRVRVVFNYGLKSRMLKFVDYGDEFKKPPKRSLRIAKRQANAKLFTAQEIRKAIKHASPQMKAMIYLAINGGLGNNDCGVLPLSSLEVEKGWLDWYRPKTGIKRRFPLWKETKAALKIAIESRPEFDGLVFVTKYGQSWAKETSTNPISQEFRKLLKSDQVNLYRHGVGFYALRHTFKTVADRSLDRSAVEFIMGHASDSIESNYVQEIDDKRLKAVTKTVRKWLNE